MPYATRAAFAGVMLANPPAFGFSSVAWLLAGGFLYGASAFPIGSLTNAHSAKAEPNNSSR